MKGAVLELMEIQSRLDSSNEWDPELNEDICRLAGPEYLEAYQNATGDNFEQVVEAACKSLGIVVMKECGLLFIFRYLDGLNAIWPIRTINDTKDMLLWYFNLDCIISVEIYFDVTLIAHYEKDVLEEFMRGLAYLNDINEKQE